MNTAFIKRRGERRTDPALGALIDVAVAYRTNVGVATAAALLRETGVPTDLARRVLDGLATLRSTTPRRRVGAALLPYSDQGR